MASKKGKKGLFPEDVIGNETIKADIKAKDAKIKDQNKKDMKNKQIKGIGNDKSLKENQKQDKKDIKKLEKEGNNSLKSDNKDKKTKNKNRRASSKNQMGKEKKHVEYGKFLMKRGDKYIGFYYRNSQGDVFRHGRGVYETGDGQTYEGLWAMDHLINNEPVKIVYEDGCMYEGTLQNYLYDGQGKYTFSDGSILQGIFRKNKPMAKIEFIDLNCNKWNGQFLSERNCILQLNNVFYRSIPPKLGLPSYEPSFGQENDENTENF